MGCVLPPRVPRCPPQSLVNLSPVGSLCSPPRQLRNYRPKSSPDVRPSSGGFSHEKQVQKRKKVALETLETEKSFVESLEIVFEKLITPLRSEQYINANELYDIFSNWEVLLRQHTKLLNKIQERVQEWDEKPTMGDVFVENTAFMKLYKHYVNNFDNSIVKLETCRKNNAKFAEFINKLEYSEELRKLSLNSYLIMPVQRIPRYVLLLQDMLKSTDASDEDHEKLTEALERVKELADYINANKSNADAIKELMDLTGRIVNLPKETLVEPRRSFVKEGTMKVKTGKKDNEKLYIFLFSDCLMYTKPSGKKYKYKGAINLATASMNSSIQANEKHHFELRSVEGNFKFTIEPHDEVEEWISLITNTLEESRKSMISTAFASDGVAMDEREGSKHFQQLKAEENFQKRTEAVNKILGEERAYLNALLRINDVFLQPMRELPEAVVSEKEIVAMFSNFEDLLQCHKHLSADLEAVVASWSFSSTIGDLFSKHTRALGPAYIAFVNNHEKSKATIEQTLKTSMNFAMFLMERESREKKNLVDLLSSPLRKMSSYYLNIQELLQYTTSRDADFVPLSEALEDAKRVNAELEQAHLHKGSKSPTTTRGSFEKKKSRSRIRSGRQSSPRQSPRLR